MTSTSFARLVAVLGIAILLQSIAFAGPKDRPLTTTKFDPSAEQINLFDGMKDGSLEVKVIAKDALGGNLFIKNTKKEPLTVKMPEGFVAVPVLAQFGGAGGGQQGGLGGQQGGQGGGGGQQAAGGGQGGQQGGQGGQQGGGGSGFFSIPPERTLRVPYTSVCLEHGKPEPHPRSNYTIIPIEEYTDEPVLQSLITMVASGRLDTQSAQAAAWHVSSSKSWNELSGMKYDRVGTADTPLFSNAELSTAQNIVATAVHLSKEKEKAPQDEQAAPATRSRVSLR